MVSVKLGELESSLSRIVRVLIIATVMLFVLTLGSTFIELDIWNEYSILSLAFGLLAIISLVFGSFKNAERRNHELEWKRFQVRELMLVRTAELKNFTDPWRKSDFAKGPYLNLHDPEIENLDKVVRSLIEKLKEEIDYSIHLGDLDTAKEVSSNIRTALQDTPWLRDWGNIYFADSTEGRDQ